MHSTCAPANARPFCCCCRPLHTAAQPHAQPRPQCRQGTTGAAVPRQRPTRAKRSGAQHRAAAGGSQHHDTPGSSTGLPTTRAAGSFAWPGAAGGARAAAAVCTQAGGQWQRGNRGVGKQQWWPGSPITASSPAAAAATGSSRAGAPAAGANDRRPLCRRHCRDSRY